MSTQQHGGTTGSARALIAGTVLAAAAVCADTASAYTLVPFDQGSEGYSTGLLASIGHNASATDMSVDYFETGMALPVVSRYASYAWFDVPAASPGALGATLALTVTGSGLFPFPLTLDAWDLTLPYAEYEVSYSTAPFQPPPPQGIALFDDMAGGVQYFSAPIQPLGATAYTFELPAAAIDALNAARGGRFGIGFSADAPTWNTAFALSAVSLDVRTPAVPTPAPTSAPLLLAGAAALVALRRRTPSQRAPA